MSTMFKRNKPKIKHNAECEFLKQHILSMKIRIEGKRKLINHLKKMHKNPLLIQHGATAHERISVVLKSERLTIARLEGELEKFKKAYRTEFEKLYQSQIVNKGVK